MTTEKRKAYLKAYFKRPQVKARRKAYYRAYRQTPEHKAQRKAHMEAYRQTLKYKVSVKEYVRRLDVKARAKARQQTPEYKAREQARHKARYQKLEFKERCKAYYQKPKTKARIKAYSQRSEHKAQRKIYRQTPEFKLKSRIATRIRKTLKANPKSGRTIKLLGCSIKYYREYLLSTMPGAKIEYLGLRGLHIDHIIPLNTFDLSKAEEQQKAFHYTNTRLLTAKEHLSRPKDGSDLQEDATRN